ncbi:MAG: hypothetical protein EHM48_02110 [Planctomycetaceae bacterium]|nr:MAG: hypothetical protein EHM48_02110 [Planctomycetaceae bacterium]
MSTYRLFVAIVVLMTAGTAVAGTYYIAPDGSDSKGDGSANKPWASLKEAVAAVPDDGSTIIVRDGLYVGNQAILRSFKKLCTIKAEHPYAARFRSPDATNRVIFCYGGANIKFEGLEVFGSGGTDNGYLIHIATRETHDITFENCIIHDSYNNDLVKINDLCRNIVFRGCLLFNVPNPGDEVFDINTVTDVVVEDCIIMSDKAGSGRENDNNNQSLIVIKNSTKDDINKEICKRITLRRNIFCNWEGRPGESYVLIGEDSKDFWEAQDIMVENNLFLFNTTNRSAGAITLKCHVRNITVRANTFCGTLNGKTSYAMRCSEEKAKLAMENIYIYNNIFTDPAGKMPRLIYGEREFVKKDLELKNNLYWNGGKKFPFNDGALFEIPKDDPAAVTADPMLADPAKMTIPRWDVKGRKFTSGQTTIRGEFERLVKTHAALPPTSPAVGKGDPKHMPADDILGNKRGTRPDIGACQTTQPASQPAKIATTGVN